MRLLSTGLGMTAVIVLLSLLYFLPGIIAWLYRRERIYAIVVLNLLTGWTIFGWFGALRWATITDTRALEEIAPAPRYRAKKRLIVAASIVALCLIFQTVRVYVIDGNSGAMASAPRPTIDPDTVSITRYMLRKDALGLRGDFTVRNGNNFKVKDVVVKCVHAAINAVVLGSTTKTLHRTFEPNHEQRVADFDLGPIPSGTANSSCSTEGFALVE